jgi:hypothetical protein
VDWIAAYVRANPANYEESLPLMTFTYNNTKHPATGFTPNQLVFGRELITPFEAAVGVPPDHPEGNRLWQHVKIIQEVAARMNREAQARYAARANKGVVPKTFWPGELVRIRRHGLKDNKFVPRWSGIHQVVEIRSPSSYILKPLEADRYGRRLRVTSHVKFLKPAFTADGAHNLPLPEEEDDKLPPDITDEELTQMGLELEDLDLRPKENGDRVPSTPIVVEPPEDATPSESDKVRQPLGPEVVSAGDLPMIPLDPRPESPVTSGLTVDAEGRRRSTRLAQKRSAHTALLATAGELTADEQPPSTRFCHDIQQPRWDPGIPAEECDPDDLEDRPAELLDVLAAWKQEEPTNWANIPQELRSFLFSGGGPPELTAAIWSILTPNWTAGLAAYKDRMHALLWIEQHQCGIDLRSNTVEGASLQLVDPDTISGGWTAEKRAGRFEMSWRETAFISSKRTCRQTPGRLPSR